MADREEKVYTARLAEQAERYNEMVESMKSIAQMDVGLNSEERNLLSVAYKNLIGARRASWRIISSIENKDDSNKSLAGEYRKQIEKELTDICHEILDLLDKHLLTSINDTDNSDQKEAAVFYNKLKGDYLRYKAEFTTGEARKEAAENALVAYKTASDKAQQDLPTTDAIRLGLALNFSVFYYEILNSPERACRLAKQAFDDAVAELESQPNDSSYKDSTLILQLLRDNLTLWTSENQPEEGDNGELQDVEDNEG